MDLEKLKEKLKSYSKEEIVVTDHAERQALFRDVGLNEVIENLLNPEKLVYAEEQPAQNPNETKYNCYFAYSKEFAHRYAFTTNGKIIIVTIIKINRDWQKTIKRK